MHPEMTTGEAEAFRAGQAVMRDRHMLALTHLRMALEKRDFKAVDRAYVLLGGVSSGEPMQGAWRPYAWPRGCKMGWDVVA